MSVTSPAPSTRTPYVSRIVELADALGYPAVHLLGAPIAAGQASWDRWLVTASHVELAHALGLLRLLTLRRRQAAGEAVAAAVHADYRPSQTTVISR